MKPAIKLENLFTSVREVQTLAQANCFCIHPIFEWTAEHELSPIFLNCHKCSDTSKMQYTLNTLLIVPLLVPKAISIISAWTAGYRHL